VRHNFCAGGGDKTFYIRSKRAEGGKARPLGLEGEQGKKPNEHQAYIALRGGVSQRARKKKPIKLGVAGVFSINQN